MIDPQTGNLNISEAIRITPGASLEWIMSLNLGELQELRDMNNGWKWLIAQNVIVRQDYFILTFCFHINALVRVDLIVSEHKYNLTAGWDTWSEVSEAEQLANLRKWLRREVGPKKNFNWGSAEALFDWKSGASTVVLKYEYQNL